MLFIIVVILFTVSSCGKDEGQSDTGAPVVAAVAATDYGLDGTYEVKCAKAVANTYPQDATVVITKDSYVLTLKTYYDDACTDPKDTAVATKALKVVEASEDRKSFKVDITYSKIEMTYHRIYWSQELYDQYGYKDWVVNVAKDVTGKNNLATVGQVFYQTISLDGDQLSVEHHPWAIKALKDPLDGYTSDTRSTKLAVPALTKK